MRLSAASVATSKVAHPNGPGKPFAPQLLTLGFDEKTAEHVDLSTLTLFEVDPESREFAPVDSSRVNVEERVVIRREVER